MHLQDILAFQGKLVDFSLHLSYLHNAVALLASRTRLPVNCHNNLERVSRKLALFSCFPVLYAWKIGFISYANISSVRAGKWVRGSPL